jgi:arylsulfatase A-like enzyme
MRIHNIYRVGTLPLLLLAAHNSEADEPPPVKTKTYPNIIYILADDMGYGDISILNKRDSKLITPNLDKLAKEGMIFTDAHSGSSVCTPTRYGILTGRYAWRSRAKKGVLNGYSRHLIEDNRMTVPSFLKNNGYKTAMFGKWHLGMDFTFTDKNKKIIDWNKKIKFSPLHYGFDNFYGISASLDMPPYIYIKNDKFQGACTEPMPEINHVRTGNLAPGFHLENVLPELTEKCAEYIIRQKNSEKPFFIYLALTAPHTPLLPTKEFQGKSGLGNYGDFCLEVDSMVGRIMQAVKDAGITENTMVIFTSDNGCAPYIGVKALEKKGHFPSYIYRGYKSDIFEGGHRVPFIVRWPGKVKPASESSETICLTDMLATCADIIGKKLPDNAGEDSLSFIPALFGSRIKHTKRAGVVHHSIAGYFALRKGKWKLEMCPGSGGWGYPNHKIAIEKKLPQIQLYNLEKDPEEKNNVTTENPEITADLKALLKDYIKNGRSTPGSTQPYVKPKKWPQINWMENE